MKLRNKKSGEIQELAATMSGDLIIEKDGEMIAEISSLAELNEEWEDAPEEPKKYWFIDAYGNIVQNEITKHYGDEYTDMTDAYESQKQIGNWFETKEEAEKAVEKLKAWKRLKDKWFRFGGWKRDERFYGDYTIEAQDYTTCSDKDLDTLFGGEE